MLPNITSPWIPFAFQMECILFEAGLLPCRNTEFDGASSLPFGGRLSVKRIYTRRQRAVVAVVIQTTPNSADLTEKGAGVIGYGRTARSRLDVSGRKRWMA